MYIASAAARSLADGFEQIRRQFHLPDAFDPACQNAADAAARLDLSADPRLAGYRDRTDLPLITLDPAPSTDLDQAFALERQGERIVLHYALADVGVFSAADGPIERSAWQRGVTIYGLPEKVLLYPATLSSDAASLLPAGPRPSILVQTAIDRTGTVELLSIERAIVRSRAKLAYDRTPVSEIPLLEEFAICMRVNEASRGATRVEFPQQEIVADPSAPGGVRLALRARNETETANSYLSLATNLALADLAIEKGRGLFRVMDAPSRSEIARLRRMAAGGFDIDWPEGWTLKQLQQTLAADNPAHQRFLLEARRAGGRARYRWFEDLRARPYHAAIGAAYLHATAPLRRLADRYVLELAVLQWLDEAIPADLISRLAQLPEVMQQAESAAAGVDRAVIDLIEAVSLQHRVGEILEAEVIDAGRQVVQVHDPSIRSKAIDLPVGVVDGETVRVRISRADPQRRLVQLQFLDAA